MAKYVNLQVGDNDLIGNKFNGHDLHINLREMGIESSHLVWNKESDDKNTYVIAGEKPDRTAIRTYNEYIQHLYDLDNVHNPLIYDIIYNKLFLDADVVHLHLMHNGLWDLNLLPLMSKLKPIVWTVHDTWAVLGDKKYSNKSEYKFPSKIKNMSLNYHYKKEVIKNSDITIVAASKYMKNILESSEIFKGKEIIHIPFGLDFKTFYPRDKRKTRKELGLSLSEKVILVRGDNRAIKGHDYVEFVMNNLHQKYRIHLLVVGGNDFVGIPSDVKMTRFGWINDDDLMAKLYSVSDLFLMPSVREAFGMMAIESMACGTLPIVLDGTALPDTVNAPTCGVSTRQDMKEYSDAVELYLNNTKERAKREKKCLDYVKGKHSMDKYLKSLDELYCSAIKDHVKDDNYDQILEKLKAFNEIKPRLKTVIADVSSGDIGKYQEKNLFFEATVEPLRKETIRLRDENVSLKDSNRDLENDISAIYNSKRYRFIDKVAGVINKIIPLRK